MKANRIFNEIKRFSIGAIGIASIALCTVSCSNEPDGEDLYTATGKTIAEYLDEDPDLSSFVYILRQVGLDKTLASYGQYTCFAPSNAGITAYIDSLYEDDKSPIPHNGMTEKSLYGLTDSLCNDIAKFHLLSSLRTIADMSGSSTSINTMLGYAFTASIDDQGRTTLNNVAHIINADNEATNGYFHKLDNAISRDTRTLPDVLHSIDGYSIFYQALVKTGLADSLKKSNKGIVYTLSDETDTNGQDLYSPKECRVAFTLFAESDEVMKANGINSFDDLVAYANDKYGPAAGWYHYLNEKGLTVNTGTTDKDFRERNNALNMFVAYHILYAGMAIDKILFSREAYSSGGYTAYNYWNYNPETCYAEVYDYFETMLPNTLMKIWGGKYGSTSQLYINRWKLNNTLTDEVGTPGSSSMHPMRQTGVKINRDLNKGALNGYIHAIDKMLVYDTNVPNGVLHERMRFETTTFLPEFGNNGLRFISANEAFALNGGQGSGARIAFPVNYFNNVYCYNGEGTKVRYNVNGAYNAWQANCFQGWGQYDLAIKLPHVPTGTYELRLMYVPMSHGGFMQFYLGTSKNVQEMEILGLPLDVRVPASDERIGLTPADEEDDLGIATDKALRNRGYMRSPMSYRQHPESRDEGTTGNLNMRTTCDASSWALRKILITKQFKQSEDYWFRIKNMISDDSELKWQFDYIEFVPVDIVNSTEYSEDWM